MPETDVEATLGALVAGVREILGRNLLAVYLTGSAAAGELDPARSDVDFLVVTEHPVDEASAGRLRLLHRDLAARYAWGGRLEGGYAARGQLRAWGIEGPIVAIRPGKPLEEDVQAEHGPSNMLAMREAGRVLAGPPPTEVIPDVDAATLVRGVRGYLDELTAGPPGEEPVDLAVRILDIARSLHTLTYRRPVLKREAGRWLAREQPHLRPIVDAASAVLTGEADKRAAGVLAARFDELAREARRLADPA